MNNNNIKTKVCRICGKELPLDSAHFHINKNNKDGFSNDCKDCCHERYVYQKNNPKVLTPKGVTRQINLSLLKEGKKRCSKCGKILPIEEFYEGHTKCKACEIENETKRIMSKQYGKKMKMVEDACEELDVKLNDDIMKVGLRLLSNRTRTSKKKMEVINQLKINKYVNDGNSNHLNNIGNE